MEYFKDCMTKEQLEREHKRLVKQLHPDLHPENPDATAEFQEMQSQYEERLAELNGDYGKARKGRERRQREERERREREAREQARRKVERVVEAARLNRQKGHREWKEGDYVYAVKVKGSHPDLKMEGILEQVLRSGMEDECVVFVEEVFFMSDDALFGNFLYQLLGGGVYGGWEVLQKADPAGGVRKAKRVAKVVMFRSENYCVFGNPMGDQSISNYYMPCNYVEMFRTHLDTLTAKIAWERQEKERIEAEKKARLLAEQTPLIREWDDKLIGMSAALSGKERETVAVSNLKTVLKAKFPGVTFRVAAEKWGGMYNVKWEDGPTDGEVQSVTDLFRHSRDGELTPWQERFGSLMIAVVCTERRMSVLTKARILQQLGQVTDAFRSGSVDDEVTVSDFDWMMLHAMVGIDVGKGEGLCMSTVHADGTRTVGILSAVRFVFRHTSYAKEKKAAKKKAA